MPPVTDACEDKMSRSPCLTSSTQQNSRCLPLPSPNPSITQPSPDNSIASGAADKMGSTIPVIDIAIIGGGISGLALAAGLCKKPHISVHVYEGAPGYKDIGAGLALHKNAIGAMSLIGPEVQKAYFDNAINIGEDDVEMVTEVILAHGPHAGELVAELGRAKGRKSISRADLLHGLVKLIPRHKITFGKKLVQIQETTNSQGGQGKTLLIFQDGTTAETDCVIGADGIHSVVRSYLLGPSHPASRPKNHDRWQVFRTLLPTDDAIKEHGIDARYTNIVSIMTGPRGHVNIIPLKKGTIISAGVAVRGVSTLPLPDSVTSASSDPETTGKLDATLYESYHPIAQPIIRMIASPSTVNTATWSVGDHDHAPYYVKRNIGMIGDAAHASLPFAGNGAAQALEDAAVLDALFKEVKQVHQVNAALLAYENVRIKRSQDVGDLARMFGRVYAHADCGFETGEGDDSEDEEGTTGKPLVQDPERLRKFFAEAAAFTNEFDVGAQNQRALEVFERLLRG